MSELESQHQAWKQARARLDGPKGKPRIVELVPRTADPAADVMDIIIAAVGNSLAIPPTEIMRGYASTDTISARRLAMALCVRRPRFSPDRVAEHFEVSEVAVQKAVSILDPILDSYVITRKTPLELSLPLIAKEWATVERVHRRRPTLESVVAATADVFNESVDDVLSTRRTADLCQARHVAVGLCKALTLRSLPEIAKFFCHRDHTTILHSVRKFEPVLDAIRLRISPAASPEMWAAVAFEELLTTPLAKRRRR